MSEIIIREFAPSDLGRVIELMIELQAFENQFAPRAAPTREFATRYIERLLRNLRGNQGVLLVAIADGAVRGFAAGYAEEEPEAEDLFFYIAELVVSERQRGRGIGSLLVKAMEDAARGRGLRRMVIGVLAGNTRVHRLYRRLGYGDYAIMLKKTL
jgi:ribosomal protein S18 acetylase RimI-like enzyme